MIFEHPTADRIASALRGLVMGAILGGTLLGTFMALQINRLPAVHAETSSEEYETVSGTLASVNVTEKKGTLTTDLGKQVAFQIVKPELFINLSPGQRITLKLDKQSRAVRVMDNAAPELPPPTLPR